MSTDAIGASTTYGLTQPTDAVGDADLDQADFMTLFITQLQYQDPLEPMDSYETASQLAQFSNMEATMKMSDNMEALLEYQMSQNNLTLLSLLGTEAQVIGNAVALSGGDASATNFVLYDTAETCTVEVFDSGGNLLYQEDKGFLDPGEYSFDWDGLDMQGTEMDDGLYYYEVSAYDANGEELSVDYRSTGTVTAISFDSGSAVLTLDDYINASVDMVVRVDSLNNTASDSDSSSSTVEDVVDEVVDEIVDETLTDDTSGDDVTYEVVDETTNGDSPDQGTIDDVIDDVLEMFE